jgi:hypothetical protein
MRSALDNGRGTLLVLGVSLIIVVILSALVFVTISRYAEHSQQQIEEVQAVLDKQKVCGDTSQQFCQDLFERLAENISREQQVELACAVAEFTTAEIIPTVECPATRKGTQ